MNTMPSTPCDSPTQISRPTCVAIMQPTYLPWIGYFDLIDQVDIFVFLDNVQFERQSWQQRNRIKAQQELQWLSVPVLRSGRFPQLISEVEIVRSALFPQKHVRSIEQNYRQTPYFARYFPQLKAVLERNILSLAQLNESIVRCLAEMLGLKTECKVSSALKAEGKRFELLANICLELGATRYLSPIGSVEYLVAEHDIFQKHGITVVFQNFQHPQYRQLSEPFLPFASVIDLLFNEGERALSIIRSGRRPSYAIDEVRNLVLSAESVAHP